ncbi:hypothetical protein VTK26DRAFT_3527 [Humicola hyalothermophila]
MFRLYVPDLAAFTEAGHKPGESILPERPRVSSERILYHAGCRNVTIDDRNLAYFCSEKMLASFRDANEDADALLASYVRLDNVCLTPRPGPDFYVGIYLYRGNFAYSRYFFEGGYDCVAKTLFNDIDADTPYNGLSLARASITP